jgi:hypothetical protein
MKKNLIITENQFEVIVNNLLITEKLGVPENILDSATILYDIIAQYLRGLNYESEEYVYATNIDLQIEDVILKRLELDVNVNVFDSYEGKAELVDRVTPPAIAIEIAEGINLTGATVARVAGIWIGTRISLR